MDEFLAGFADRPNLPTSPSFHAMEESSSKKLMRDHPSATAASVFTDDLILEILSRLPARSVHRFKCVSTPWRDLIADPVNRKKLPQTLAGFLYSASNRGGGDWSPHFATVSGGAAPVDPSLHFLQPKKYKYIALLDTCHGLLLCSCYNKDDFRYVVCNPATEKWIELPPQPQDQAKRLYSATRLAFDPAVSSHFRVLRFGETNMDVGSCVTGVDIFSSQTGAWTQRDCGLVEKIALFHGIRSVFFGGMLHLVGRLNTTCIDQGYVLVVVDMEGKAWKTIRFPVGSGYGTIGLSQGCLCYASTTGAHVYNSNKENDVQATKITLWFLENYDSKEWVLRHSADIDDPFGITGSDCRVIAYHPDCDTVYLVGRHMLASYSMQHQKLVHILNLEKNNLWTFLPYVPLFSEALADADRQ